MRNLRGIAKILTFAVLALYARYAAAQLAAVEPASCTYAYYESPQSFNMVRTCGDSIYVILNQTELETDFVVGNMFSMATKRVSIPQTMSSPNVSCFYSIKDMRIARRR